ncbi:hypothetical protein ACIA5E_21030 [Nocardia asteroides]|uniref:hypothetical protein n=1 Tax=Nocardia asteroides TaxID=1824 RepID=UPI00378D47C8
MRVMLCGASDTDDVRDQFAEVITGFGGEPLHFLSGSIQYLNSADASWSKNSEITIRAADLCVFVIVEDFGEITWGTELRSLSSPSPTATSHRSCARSSPSNSIGSSGTSRSAISARCSSAPSATAAA